MEEEWTIIYGKINKKHYKIQSFGRLKSMEDEPRKEREDWLDPFWEKDRFRATFRQLKRYFADFTTGDDLRESKILFSGEQRRFLQGERPANGRDPEFSGSASPQSNEVSHSAKFHRFQIFIWLSSALS